MDYTSSKDAEKKIKKLKNQRNELGEQLQTMAREIEDLRARLQSAENSIGVKQEKIYRTQGRIEALEGEVTFLRNELAQARGIIAGLQFNSGATHTAKQTAPVEDVESILKTVGIATDGIKTVKNVADTLKDFIPHAGGEQETALKTEETNNTSPKTQVPTGDAKPFDFLNLDGNNLGQVLQDVIAGITPHVDFSNLAKK